MFDAVIVNARLIDPEGKAPHRGCVGIRSGKIAAVEAHLTAAAPFCLDAGGRCLCPGLIDIHGHIDGDEESARRSLMQGVTTTVGGNCGLSPLAFDAFFERQHGFYINQAELVGHSFSIRRAAGATDPYLAATREQVSSMVMLAERALDAGAAGLSLGLDYAPGSGWEELLAMARVCAKYGRLMPVHTRMRTASDLYSLTEVCRLAGDTGVHAHISHLVYQYLTRPAMEEALLLIDYAAAHSQPLSVDSGLYTSFAAPLGTTIFDLSNVSDAGWTLEQMMITTGAYTGSYLNFELYRKLRADEPDTSVVVFTGDAEAIDLALAHENVMPSSDTGPCAPGQGHPQTSASFVKYFERMVREKRQLSMQEAVRRATLLPARTLNLSHKGRLAPGADADLLLFDPEQIGSNANFAGLGIPDAPPAGIVCVWVAGRLAVKDGTLTGIRAGEPIRF